MKKLIASALRWASNKIDGKPADVVAVDRVSDYGPRSASGPPTLDLSSMPEPEGVAGAIARARNPADIEVRWARYNQQFCQVAWTHASRHAAGEHYKKATHAARLVLPPPPPGAPPRPRGMNPDHIVCDDCAEHARRNGGWALSVLPGVPESTDLGTAIEGPSNGPEDVENTTAAGAD